MGGWAEAATADRMQLPSCRRNAGTHLLLHILLGALVRTAQTHNWINNPASRITGLTKELPCPAKPSPSSVNFVVSAGQPFPVEWSTGHPQTFTWFAMIASGDEDKLQLHTEALFEDYIASAPAGTPNIAGMKNHVRWTGGRNGQNSGGPLPTPGQGDGALYAARLQQSDAGYIERAATWRCSRNEPRGGCGEIAQYSYIASAGVDDIGVGYASAKYPWLLAVFRYRIVKKRPQDYDLAMLSFPATTSPGSYVLQYVWNGYRDCFDALVTVGTGDGGAVSSPTIVTEEVWVKSDHCQFEDYTFGRRSRCSVLEATGVATLDVSTCLATCESEPLGCTAANVVPLVSPPSVRFRDSAPPNIPFNNRRCKQADLLAAADAQPGGADASLVCYGLVPPSEPPEVGDAYTLSDDPRDATFFSTCWRKETITRVAGTPPAFPNNESAVGLRWAFGDSCVECDLARAAAQAGPNEAVRWQLAEECKRCAA